MKKRQTAILWAFLVILAVSLTAAAADEERGLIIKEEGHFEGYTLLAPIGGTTTFLIDMSGRIVNTWESDYPPGQSAYLLGNGHLLRTASVGPENRIFRGGGSGGRVQEFTWEGELVWNFEYSSDLVLLHHDIERLPNGNILMIAWEKKSMEEADAAGRDPEKLGREGLWPDTVIEVKPEGKTGGKIVWQWHVWDHLIQDIDPGKANYGKVAEHPELIDINPLGWEQRLTQEQRERLAQIGYLGSARKRGPKNSSPDWNHTNSIAYNAELDQIVLSVLGFNEIWIIDHSTTTKEAASHKGGRSGKGGDLLYRWGNAKTYQCGTSKDQRLFAQHDAHWIPDGLPGAGGIMVFNNGRGRRGVDYSSIDVIVPPVDGKGRYSREKGTAFGPASAAFSYSAEEKADFYSGHISGAQRLPNGNTFICSGESGTLFEVTAENRIVWKYVNPILEDRGPGGPQGRGGPGAGFGRPGRERGEQGDRPGRDGFERGNRRLPPPQDRGGMPPGGKRGPKNSVFRAYCYGADYAGLKDRKLTPGKTLQEWRSDQERNEPPLRSEDG